MKLADIQIRMIKKLYIWESLAFIVNENDALDDIAITLFEMILEDQIMILATTNYELIFDTKNMVQTIHFRHQLHHFVIIKSYLVIDVIINIGVKYLINVEFRTV
jgi:hypothetical protein